jgi:hypothetical protein
MIRSIDIGILANRSEIWLREFSPSQSVVNNKEKLQSVGTSLIPCKQILEDHRRSSEDEKSQMNSVHYKIQVKLGIYSSTPAHFGAWRRRHSQYNIAFATRHLSHIGKDATR